MIFRQYHTKHFYKTQKKSKADFAINMRVAVNSHSSSKVNEKLKEIVIKHLCITLTLLQ